jgi:hypothetical protein
MPAIASLAFLLLFTVRWLRQRRGKKPAVKVIKNPKVMVASLGDAPLSDIGATDATVYSAYFDSVGVAKLPTAAALSDFLVEEHPDILHLYCNLNENGELTDDRGGTLPGGAFLEACRRAGVTLLFFASDNPGDHYSRAFSKHRRGPGNGVDVVWTLERRGENFPFFLGELLKGMSKGEPMLKVWVQVAPQAQGEWMEKLPSTVYMPNS